VTRIFLSRAMRALGGLLYRHPRGVNAV